MRMTRLLAACGVVLASMASFAVAQPAQTASVAVGPQYDTTHGGERGIRTLVTVSRKHAFQACAFNHSATSPRARRPLLGRPAGGRRAI